MGLQKYRADTAGETYPNGGTPWYASWIGGPSLALIRNCVCENMPAGTDPMPRTVYVRGEPDSYTSQPAACRVRGKTIAGCIKSSRDETGLVFHAYNIQGKMPVATSKYSVRYVHKIRPRDTDIGSDVALPDGCFSNRNTLGKALRRAGVLLSGGRITTFRVEGDKVTCFPSVPGMTTYWHAIVLTCHESEQP